MYITNYDKNRKPLSKKQRSQIPGKYRYIGATSVNDYISKCNFDGIYLLLGEDGTVQDDMVTQFYNIFTVNFGLIIMLMVYKEIKFQRMAISIFSSKKYRWYCYRGSAEKDISKKLKFIVYSCTR